MVHVGHRKFLWGGGLKSQLKILDAKYEAKLEFPGVGGGVQNKKPSVDGEYGEVSGPEK